MAQLPFAGLWSGIGRVTGPIASRLGRRGTLVLRDAEIAVLALIVFVLALQATFPYERVKDRAIEALSGSYDVSIGSVERGWKPGRVFFKAVTLRTRPTKPEEMVSTFFIEKLEVDLGILAVLGMNASVNLDAKIGAGHITGNITFPKFGKAGVKIDLDGTDLPGANLPLRSVIGLPMTGKLDFSLAIDLPVSKNKMGRTSTDWSKVDGSFDLSCPTGCTLGDGHTKLKPLLKNRSNQVMVGNGIDFGEVHIASMDVHAAFTPAVGDPDAHSSSYKPGKFEVTKFDIKSPDGELHVEYMMTMAQSLDESIVAGCLRFKASDNLLKKEETKKTYAAISTTGAELRADGLFHIKLSDRFKEMKRLNADCGPNAPAAKLNNGEDFSQHSGMRPTIPPPVAGSANPPPPPSPEPPPLPPAASAPLAGSAGSGSAGSAGPGGMPTAGPPPTEGAAAGAGGSGSAGSNEPQHLP
ncbi:MAG: type II secretion system protein GspN [Kofleriaceae bacterium]